VAVLNNCPLSGGKMKFCPYCGGPVVLESRRSEGILIYACDNCEQIIEVEVPVDITASIRANANNN